VAGLNRRNIEIFRGLKLSDQRSGLPGRELDHFQIASPDPNQRFGLAESRPVEPDAQRRHRVKYAISEWTLVTLSPKLFIGQGLNWIINPFRPFCQKTGDSQLRKCSI
jgi:hypothetical protein